MADHVRKQINDAFVALAGGIGGVDPANVFSHRRYEVAVLPAVAIYVTSETSEASSLLTMGTGGSRMLQRDLSIQVDLFAEDLATAEAMCRDIEVIAATDVPLAAVARDVYPRSTQMFFPQGETLSVVASVTFAVNYITLQNAPDVAL